MSLTMRGDTAGIDTTFPFQLLLHHQLLEALFLCANKLILHLWWLSRGMFMSTPSDRDWLLADSRG